MIASSSLSTVAAHGGDDPVPAPPPPSGGTSEETPQHRSACITWSLIAEPTDSVAPGPVRGAGPRGRPRTGPGRQRR